MLQIAAALRFDIPSARRQARQQQLRRKRTDGPIAPAVEQDGEAAQREPASPRFRAAHYW
jgi:hypothetical protein